MLWAGSRAPLSKLQKYKQRMGWTFPWASSVGSDFNFDFNVSFTEEQQREGTVEYNYQRGGHAMDATPVPEPVIHFAATCGTDASTFSRDMPGMSAFMLEDGDVYHIYSTYARGLDGLWGMYHEGADITKVGDALWWAVVTVATVGYGDYYPVTTFGRIIAVSGIGIFVLLVGSLSQRRLHRRVKLEEEDSSRDIR